MAPSFVPFASGPTRPKEVLSLGFYRTGSHSLKQALTILGYRDVIHSSAMTADVSKYFGPCEALTDVTPFAEPLLRAYPKARVILVHRDFASWVESFQRTVVLPSSEGLLAQLSGNLFEPMLGIHISQAAWKMYMGLFGVCDLRKTRDRRIMRTGYDYHYYNVRRIVPPERLLELDLKDLTWDPLCEFLGKEVPDVPFPRLNESRVFQNDLHRLHTMALFGVLVKFVLTIAVTGVAAGYWITRVR
ncbi:Fc.00g105110.m01.CDS01 [Cosmosporella sp. VM-42]